MELSMKNYLNHYTYREYRASNPRPALKCTSTPSLTIPDLSLTIDELLVRYERGLPLPVQKTPLYEDPSVPSTGRSVSTMDLVDLHYYKKSRIDRLEILRDTLQKQVEKNRSDMEKRNAKAAEFNAWYEKAKKDDKEASRTNNP